MHTFSRKYQGKLTEFTVLTKAEAEEQKVAFKSWREAINGDKALTDDGYVVDCLKVQVYTDKIGKHRALKSFSIGRVFVSAHARLKFEERLATKNFYGTSSKTWQEREVTMGRTKKTVELYVRQLFSGTVDWAVLGKTYRSDQKIPEATVRRLFKQEAVKRMVNKEIEKHAKDLELDANWVLLTLKRATGIAETVGDAGSMIRAAKAVTDLLELEPKKEQSGEGDEGSRWLSGVSDDVSKSVLEAQKEFAGLQEKAVDAKFNELEGSPDAAQEAV